MERTGSQKKDDCRHERQNNQLVMFFD